jgi:hypothetical protein
VYHSICALQALRVLTTTGDGALSDRADLRALSASLDLFGSQFGSQKQKRGRMSDSSYCAPGCFATTSSWLSPSRSTILICRE